MIAHVIRTDQRTGALDRTTRSSVWICSSYAGSA